jgi:membrane peptidoglycan carboxypeptidase
MGYPEGNSKPMDDVHGTAVTGGTLPAKIWQKFMSAALVDVPPDGFPDPPAALLADEPLDVALRVQPSSGNPGATITADGTGYKRCAAGWYVTAGNASTTPQTGSTDDQRSASVTIPDDSAPGPIDIQAWCDTGSGAQAVAHATFTVNGDTSSTTSSTTTTEAPPPSTTTTSSSTTTSTTPPPPPTSTTRPGQAN